MVKKNLITCSVILGLMMVASLFICGVPDKKPLPQSTAFFNAATRQKSVENTETTKETPLNFAHENVPVHNVKVKRKIQHSLWKHKSHREESAALKQKAKKWFPIIEPILRLYGIPEDFKYIPLLESGFDNSVVSGRGAAGFWQFMPQTARDYGLKVNRGRDDRLNTRKATIAACKYIKELYEEFDSWTLAAAAYNCGSPRVQHAITRKNKGNYFLMSLNRETSSYVYKLVALKQVVGKPKPKVKAQPVQPEIPALYTMLKSTEMLNMN